MLSIRISWARFQIRLKWNRPPSPKWRSNSLGSHGKKKHPIDQCLCFPWNYACVVTLPWMDELNILCVAFTGNGRIKSAFQWTNKKKKNKQTSSIIYAHFQLVFTYFFSARSHRQSVEWYHWRFGQRFGRHVICTVERIEVSSIFYIHFCIQFPIKMFIYSSVFFFLLVRACVHVAFGQVPCRGDRF